MISNRKKVSVTLLWDMCGKGTGKARPMATEDVEKMLDKANMQLASGEFQKAFNSFKRIAKQHPDLSKAYFGMAEASMGVPKLTIQEIASYYQKACDIEPENPLLLATYGNFCFENGILKKGEECFLRASETDEKNSHMYLSELATSYFQSTHRFINHYPNITHDDIAKKSLKYILMAFDLQKDKAKELIGQIE